MRKLSVLELNRISKEEFKKIKKIPLVIVLDNIRSLNNIGSVFRTSDAFKISKIFLCGITATPPNAEIHKTALGAEESVEWEYFEDTCSVISLLHSDNYKIYSAEQTEDSIKINDFKVNREFKYAIILGNEVKGVQQKVVDMCDGSIEIPQYGTKHSLNVSVASGIIIWDLFEKLYL